MSEAEDNFPNEEQIVQELREFLVQSEEVPPAVAARVEAAIRSEAERVSRVSWAEVTVMACLVFSLIGSAVPSSATIPVLGICVIISGAYSAGVRWVLRGKGA